jgi:N-methylhydantoinase A
MRRIAIDTGGTFTDCVLADESAGTLTLAKVPSTPTKPSNAVGDGLDALLSKARLDPRDVDVVLHGTTVATNAVITGQWAKAGMICTAGSRDVLEIGTQQRPRMYALDQVPTAPLVPRDRRLEVPGRIAADGTELEPLEDAAIVAAVDALLADGVEAIAVAGLFGCLHPRQEQAIEAIVRARAPAVYVVRSSAVSAEIREFPRYATTAVNAALAPMLDRYIGGIDARLLARGAAAPLFLMQSNGGVTTARRSIGESAHRLVLSGPAAGVLGGAMVATAAGSRDVVTFDMGGTSADIGVVTDGLIRDRADLRLENGLPLQVPSLEVEAIGAGGGSIAWVDAGGALHVGPQSASAEPGPACYAMGGTEATVTDAHLVLGHLHPDRFLAGAQALDPDAACRAVEAVGHRFGLGREEMALGILAVADANMARAMRRAAARHGDDLRGYALVAAGGAGALHAAGLVAELGMAAVLVPPNPGLLSALGLLEADLRHDIAAPTLMPVAGADPARLTRIFADLTVEANSRLDEDGVDEPRRSLTAALDLRYIGQEWSMTVPCRRDETLGAIATRFHALHERVYGHAAPEEPVEVVTARIVAGGRFERTALAAASGSAARDPESRDVRFAGETRGRATSIVHRATIRAGDTLSGPAVVEQLDTTTLIPPGWMARALPAGSLLLEAGR